MALDLFWPNFYSAARQFGPVFPSPDSTSPDPDAVRRALEGTGRWLTPDTILGFDSKDFDFLEPEQQEVLRQAVERFRAVADQVPDNKPPTPEQRREAAPAFLDMLRILRPDVFLDAEGLRVQTLVRRALEGKMPPWVVSITCETGTDHTEEPAVWVWLAVTDQAIDRGMLRKKGLEVLEQVQTAVRRTGTRLYPYIRFRDASAVPHLAEGKQA